MAFEVVHFRVGKYRYVDVEVLSAPIAPVYSLAVDYVDCNAFFVFCLFWMKGNGMKWAKVT